MITTMSLRFAACLLLMLAAGCSSFDRDWEAFTDARPGDPLTGRWQGTWRSEPTGHSGDLRCIITLIDAEPAAYRARFHATFARVLSFKYAVTMHPTQRAGTWHLEGNANLGRAAGGSYRYDATIDGNHFDATYDADADHGVFSMTRVE